MTYRGAETSSTFYQQMRSAFATPGPSSSTPTPSIGHRTTIAEIQGRLRAIGATPHASSSHAAAPPGASYPAPHAAQAPVPLSAASAGPQYGGQSLAESAKVLLEPTIAAVRRPHSGASGALAPVPVQPPAEVGVDDDETLSPQELRSLRMVEIGCTVRVHLGELHHPPKPFQLLAEEANVKILPRHVFITRAANGAPVAEIHILELSELTEDEFKGTLSFFICKPNNPTTTIVEVYCADAAARSAMYKIVCSKRSSIEQTLEGGDSAAR